MCLASRTGCGSPSSTLPWQRLWWSLITYSDSQGARRPTMRGESVETGSTDPDWALLSGPSPAKQCIRYSWDKAFGTQRVHIVPFPSGKSHTLAAAAGLTAAVQGADCPGFVVAADLNICKCRSGESLPSITQTLAHINYCIIIVFTK